MAIRIKVTLVVVLVTRIVVLKIVMVIVINGFLETLPRAEPSAVAFHAAGGKGLKGLGFNV